MVGKIVFGRKMIPTIDFPIAPSYVLRQILIIFLVHIAFEGLMVTAWASE